MEIVKFTKDLIPDILAFERELRIQEPDTYFWDIDEKYIENMQRSFEDRRFTDCSLSFLAYSDGKVVGRIDSGIVYSRFDGKVSQAYLDWICVLKSERHKGVGRALMDSLKGGLKERGVSSLIVLTAENGESSSFYDNCDNINFYRGAMINI